MGGVAQLVPLLPPGEGRKERKDKERDMKRTLVSLSLLSELGEVDGIFTGVGHSEGTERRERKRGGRKGRKKGQRRGIPSITRVLARLNEK